MSDALPDDDRGFGRKNRLATDRLASLLREQHDYSVRHPKDLPRKIARKIEIKVKDFLSVTPIEICVLPIRDAVPTVDAIKRVVCRHFGISHRDIVSQRRLKQIVRPRQIAMYLCAEHARRSTPDIGRMIGGKDHTTVLHAIGKIKELMLTDWEIAHDVANLEAQL